jgi:ATP:ADP antiporter, AAA family
MRAPDTRPSLLDRILRVVAEVRPGEGLGAILLTLTLFVIFVAYYALKTAREGLILGDDIHIPLIGDVPGREAKIGGSGAMALLMLVIIPAYGALASRVPRKRLLEISYALVIGALASFVALARSHYEIGLAFFVWLGIVNMFLIAQFWSYANDLYSEEQGKRLFAIIAIGGSTGAILGPRLKGLTTTLGMMTIAAALLVVVIVLIGVVEKVARRSEPASKIDAPLAKDGGFQLVLRDRYLLLMGIMLVLANMVNTIGEFILSATFEDAANAAVAADAPDRIAQVKETIGGYAASFFFWVNLIGFVIQSFLASRIIKYAGVRVALFVMPATVLAGYGAIGLIGGLTLIRIAKIAENSIDYSLQNTVRHTLFLPTSREVKYKAKAAIDTVFVRLGDVAAAILVLLGVRRLGLDARSFALINVAVIVVWLLVVAAIARHHRAREAHQARQAREPRQVATGAP